MSDIKKSYKTNGSKELNVVNKPNSGHMILQWSDGGKVPSELSGTYTGISFIDRDVLTYLKKTEIKPKLNEAEKAKAKYERKQAKKLEEI